LDRPLAFAVRAGLVNMLVDEVETFGIFHKSSA
jgi:hypothetical protein